MDPFSTALIAWATGKGATASERALVRAWKGDAQSNELTKIAREAVASCVEEIVALPDRKVIEEALLRNREASPNFQALESQDLQHQGLRVGPVLTLAERHDSGHSRVGIDPVRRRRCHRGLDDPP